MKKALEEIENKLTENYSVISNDYIKLK